jgi:hypothetical protein
MEKTILIPDWWTIIKRSWAVKASIALTVVGFVEFLFGVFGDGLFDPITSGAIKALFGPLLIILRVLAQKEITTIVGGGEEV